ncbi:MAG: PQQ-binding-like beta-propeller repeat protein [Candidatus Eremiobacteraeota bacterium]|nr:PQQ-binding-like beta-propeller repeat protein [Candidatus Eremiobacteraeota bacterium]MBV8375154.1 PQQ-binding-like beta-propeller repeat protein [Candidatus Eremiobacteraeota bacterium]
MSTTCRRVIALAVLAFAAPATSRGEQTFDAQRSNAWTQFRNGAGLNDVVVNAQLPREPTWRFSTPEKGTSTSPVVAGKLVLLAANDHSLYAVDGATGRLVWQFRGDNEIMSAPVYRDGIAVIGTGDADSPVYDLPAYNVVGMGPSDLAGIDLATGKKLWSFKLTGSGMPMPALFGSTLLHVDGNGTLVALDYRSGRYLWRRLFYSNASMTNVLIVGGRAYFGGRAPNAVYAFSPSDGAPLWVHPFPTQAGAFDDCPLASDGKQLFGMYAEPTDGGIVLARRRARQHVYALDAATGRLRWDTTLNVVGLEPDYNEAAVPTYANGMLYEGSPLAPDVVALDARNGRVRWTLRVSGAVKGAFVLRDGVLYFGDYGGKLWAVDALRGRVLGSVQTDLDFYVGSPIALNDSLVIGSQQGPLIAIPLKDIRASRHVSGVTRGAHHLVRRLLIVLGIVILCALALWLTTLRGLRRRSA